MRRAFATLHFLKPMREKDFNTGLRGVLFEAGHYARMGSAVWLYGWLVLRQTHQSGGIGYVLGGSPLTYREIEEETGFNRRTLEAWMRTLRREGYIETRQDRGGIVVLILKAKKHRKPTSLTLPSNQENPRRTRQRGVLRAGGASDGVLRECAETGREFAEQGPSIGVATRAYPAQTQRFAAANGSSSVVEIKKNREAEIREVQSSAARSLRHEQAAEVNREPLEILKPPIQPSYLETNQTTSENLSTSTTDGEIRYANVAPKSQLTNNVKPTTPNPLHGFARVYNPHETKLPWELRKRMQLERAARDEELRRELYVGTGPEGRRT
jgi:DNA-binding transcriptional ArsR family regulator